MKKQISLLLIRLHVKMDIISLQLLELIQKQKKIFLQPWIHILRDPNVYSERFNYYGKDWRGYSLNSNILRGFHWWDKDHRKMLGIGVEVIVYANNDKAADQWF